MSTSIAPTPQPVEATVTSTGIDPGDWELDVITHGRTAAGGRELRHERHVRGHL